MGQMVVPVAFNDAFVLTGTFDGRVVEVSARDGLLYIDDDVAERAQTPRHGPATYQIAATVGESLIGTVLAIMRSIDSTEKVTTAIVDVARESAEPNESADSSV